MSTSIATRPALSLAELETYDPYGKGRGAEKIYRCPVCQSDERALHVNTQTGAWNCKRASCAAKGKLKDFWTDRPKPPKQDRARLALRRAFALAEPSTKPKSEPETAATWREYFDSSSPITGTPGAAYLEGRAIPEHVSNGARYLDGLYGRPAVVFPFHDQAGAPCAFLARHSDGKPDGHRALGPRSDGVFLTAPDALKAETVIVCEAPIDALSLAACGLPCIALGCTRAPGWLAKALAFRHVILGLDNDGNGAGDSGAQDLAASLQAVGSKALRLKPYRTPDQSKSDWNTMLQTYGAPLLLSYFCGELREAGCSDWLDADRLAPRSRYPSPVYARDLYDPAAALHYADTAPDLTDEQRETLRKFAIEAGAA
jgi:hypothetical protein